MQQFKLINKENKVHGGKKLKIKITDSFISGQKCSPPVYHLKFLIFLIASITLFYPGTADATGFINIKSSKTINRPSAVPSVTISSENVVITIQNQMVKTKVVQIFKNNTERILEGEYLFPLPYGANIVSFATWDNGVKINGVIMEKVKAKKLYEDIVAKLKDPGLLENAGSNVFRAKIFPIPAFGTKRLELEYVEYLPLLNNSYSYSYPLHNNDFEINPRELSIDVVLKSDFEISDPLVYFKNLTFSKDDKFKYALSYHTTDFSEKIDFKLAYELKTPGANAAITYSEKYENTQEIYFLTNFRPQASGIANTQSADTSEIKNRKNIKAVFLIDTSSSMTGEKINILKNLFAKTDSLSYITAGNVILFSSDAKNIFSNFLAAGEAFAVKTGTILNKLRPYGGSNPQNAINTAFELISADNKTSYEKNCSYMIILISDGRFSTLCNLKGIEKTISDSIKKLDFINGTVTLSTVGIGSDCDTTKLCLLSNAGGGEFRPVAALNDEQLADLFNVMAKAQSGNFLKELNFKTIPENAADLYPKNITNINAESECYSVGKLSGAFNQKFDVAVSYKLNNASENLKISCDPAKTSDAWYIPLLWGRERVNYLTKTIEQNGDNEKLKKEIIKLSKRFNFVTKYTSFIAVPGSILRPRRIKPGDPEILVKAPADSKKVIISLPFGEPLDASFDNARKAFVARFTAPANIKDGQYAANVIIIDKFGRESHYAENFTIDSTPPQVYAKCIPDKAENGAEIIISVNASADTASIKAKFADGGMASSKYDRTQNLSIIRYLIPVSHAAGNFKAEIEAIDHAGNRTLKYIDYSIVKKQAATDNTPIQKAGAF